MKFDARQFIVERRLLAPRRQAFRLAQIVSSSHKNAQESHVDQAASSANGQQSHSDTSVVDSTSTWRSNGHERNKHSYLSEARVLEYNTSLKTVDSLSCTGENKSSKGLDLVLRSSHTENSGPLYFGESCDRINADREHTASELHFFQLQNASFGEQTSQTKGKYTEPSFFDDSIINLAPVNRELLRKITRYAANRSILAHQQSIAHNMFLCTRNMGEYTRAIPSLVISPSSSSAPLPLDDVSAPSPPQFCHGGCGRAARIQSRFRLSYCCDSCEDDGSHDEECGLSVHQLKDHSLTDIAGSPTDQQVTDDTITDADSITDESTHTLTSPPAPHSGKYEVRQI
jgi:hypothetical protein